MTEPNIMAIQIADITTDTRLSLLNLNYEFCNTSKSNWSFMNRDCQFENTSSNTDLKKEFSILCGPRQSIPTTDYIIMNRNQMPVPLGCKITYIYTLVLRHLKILVHKTLIHIP